MNVETAQYIKQIVVDASNTAVKATLKAAKESLIRGKLYQVCTRDNVDLDVVSECVQDLLECRAKSVFARCVNNLVWSMDRIIEEQVLARHVAHTVRKFKDETGIEVDAETVERVLKRVNKAGEGFSYNRAKTELLAMQAEREAIPQDTRTWTGHDIFMAHMEALVLNETPEGYVNGLTVEVGQVIEDEQGRAFVVTQVMRMAGYTDASGHIEGNYPVTHSYRSCRFDTCQAGRMEYGVVATRLVRPAPETLAAEAERMAEELRADGLAVTAEQFDRVALAERARAKKVGRPVKLLQATFIKEESPVTSNGRAFRVFVIHLNNGKHYKFTEGFNHLQIIAYGPARTFLRTVRNARIQTAIDAAVKQYDAIHADKSA